MVRIHPDPPIIERTIRGAIAQLGERLLCKQEVTGSIPVGSTKAMCANKICSDAVWRHTAIGCSLTIWKEGSCSYEVCKSTGLCIASCRRDLNPRGVHKLKRESYL